MKQFQSYMARDGHTFTAYMANPEGQARAAVIIVQEIFGVTPWIKRIADGYAADGYLAVAPQLFDRIQRNLVLDYSDTEHARGYRQQIPLDKALLDIAASAAVVKHVGRVGIIGFCWGGTLAWASAGSVAVSAAVCYYGAGILEQSSRVPKCPTMLHFGEQDKGIALSDVQRVRDAYPQGQFHLYPAGHGFANEDRPDHYDAASAALARTRTLDFLHQYVG